jgi:hypothetical protein
MRVPAFSILVILLFGTFFGCEKNGEFIERLTPEQRSVFPQDYYTLDTLHMIYSDTGRIDTVVLLGGKVEEYVIRDWHAGGDDGWTTSHETIRKQFQSIDGKYSMAIRVSTSDDIDNGYPSNGGVLITAFKRNVSFYFHYIQNTTEDQVIEAYRYNTWDKPNTVIYNRVSGVKKILIRGGVYVPYTLEFY